MVPHIYTHYLCVCVWGGGVLAILHHAHPRSFLARPSVPEIKQRPKSTPAVDTKLRTPERENS